MKSSIKKALADGLRIIPDSWHLTPVGANKQPILKDWLNAKTTLAELTELIESGSAKGYGLVLGEASLHQGMSPLLAVDFDGIGTDELAVELNDGQPLPDTVAWTSGREGHHSRLYCIPIDFWGELLGHAGFRAENGAKLELRYNGHKCVLPPSQHPETGRYKWITPPAEFEAWDKLTYAKIPFAPQWMIDALLKEPQGREPSAVRWDAVESTDRDWAIEYMEAISRGWPSDDYQDWIRVGIALKSLGDDFFPLWDSWSSTSAKYDGNTQKKWDGFKPRQNGIKVLAWFAKKAGWTPKKKSGGENLSQTNGPAAAVADGVSQQGQSNGDAKPILLVQGGKIIERCEEALKYLGSLDNPRERFYYQSGMTGYSLVRVIKPVNDIKNRHIFVGKDNDVIEHLTPDTIQYAINKHFEVQRLVETSKGGFKPVSIDCPKDYPKMILAMGRYPQLSKLMGISNVPLLTKSGEIICESGYHKQTGYLLQFESSQFRLKTNPTKNDALKALNKLKDLIKEFCFKTEVDRSAALSLLLTSVSRKLYQLAPLHAVNAHQPGNGKGTLTALASVLSSGNLKAGVTSFTDDDAEMNKKILSILLSGASAVNIDNVDKRLGGSALEKALTESVISDRLLGTNRFVSVQAQVTWTANGNNMQFSTDMNRRTILIELDAGVEKPELRQFERNDIEGYAIANRADFVSAALTAMQAYIQEFQPFEDNGRNFGDAPFLGSFGDWDKVVRRTLLWLGEPDPVQSQETIREADDSQISLGVFLETWHRRLGAKSMQVKDILQYATSNEGQGDFRDCLTEVCADKNGMFSARLLGYYLRRHNGVVINGFRLVRAKKTKMGTAWTVQERVTMPKVSSPPLNIDSARDSAERVTIIPLLSA